MYNTGLTAGHTEIKNWETWSISENIPNMEYSWYSPPPKPIEFPNMSLKQYFEAGLLQRGCENLKTQRKRISENIDFLSYNY